MANEHVQSYILGISILLNLKKTVYSTIQSTKLAKRDCHPTLLLPLDFKLYFTMLWVSSPKMELIKSEKMEQLNRSANKVALECLVMPPSLQTCLNHYIAKYILSCRLVFRLRFSMNHYIAKYILSCRLVFRLRFSMNHYIAKYILSCRLVFTLRYCKVGAR